MRNKVRITVFLVAFTIIFQCLNLIAQSQTLAENTVKLRVAMYPYIPLSDKSLTDYIESEFKKNHKHIDLILRPLDQNDNFYDLETLKLWLTNETEADSYDLVEIDTVLLGDLVSEGVITPWNASTDKTDWHPLAFKSVMINDAIYAIPHLLCGHFIFSRNETVAAAKNINEFIRAVDGINNDLPNLVGNFLGSWNLPSLYLDAWSDNNTNESLGYALTVQIDNVVLNNLKLLSNECVYNDKNPCIDGTYDEWENRYVPAQMFGKDKADTLIGYSERLHYVIKAGADEGDIYVSSVPIGNSDDPALFVDGFVLRRGIPENVREAALKFVEFINSPKMQEAVMMSADSKESTPRYLIPATRSAFNTQAIKNDRFYTQIKELIDQSSKPFPNTGFYIIRKMMRDEIQRELTETP